MLISRLSLMLLIATLATQASPLLAGHHKKGEKKKKAAYEQNIEEAKKVASFNLMGEYLSSDKKTGLQVATLPDDTFHVLKYAGGLPGDGWTGSPAIETSIKKADEVKSLIADMTKVERVSPTMGMKPPAGAKILFESPENHAFKNPKLLDGLMGVGTVSNDMFGDFKLHIEFRMAYKPWRNISNQDRGNSGLYIFNRYEVQVLDSFGLDYQNPENNKVKLESLNTQWCGNLYKKVLGKYNMSRPPLSWQTYDIDFTAPKFEGDKKIANARITVKHNGVIIHDDVELDKGTGNGGKRKEVAQEKLYIQNHGNDVRFRNIWIMSK